CDQLADSEIVVQDTAQQVPPGGVLVVVQRVQRLEALDCFLIAGTELHQFVPFLSLGLVQHLAGQVGDFLVALEDGGVRRAQWRDFGQWLGGGSPNWGSTAVCQAPPRSVSIFSAVSSLASSLRRLASIRSRMMSS